MNDRTAEYGSVPPPDPGTLTSGAHTLTTPGTNLIGRMLNGAYRVEAVIGAGGMGVVYKATQITLGRPVAVKTILNPSTDDDRAVQRFFREAKLLSQLNHPNVIHVIDFGTAEPGPVHFMVAEFLTGEPLDVYLRSHPRMPVDMIFDIMAQLCAGVSAAHAAGIVHRDLKPSNVFLMTVSGSPVPMVKILDFGLAKAMVAGQTPSTVTRVGTMLGTPGYSSPEQIQGSPDSDPRSDVYGLGAILYALVSGDPPYSGPTFQAVLAKQLTAPPDPLDPEKIGAERVETFRPIIHRAMAATVGERYQTPAELMADLERACRPNDTPNDRKAPSWVSRATAKPAAVGAALPTLTGRGADTVEAAPGANLVGRVVATVAGVALVAAVAGWLVFLRPPGGGTNPAVVPVNAGATAPGVTADEIRFGMTAPFSDSARELGRGMRTGIEVAFHQVNDAGGVHGRKLKLVSLDDGYKPERAAENMLKLLGDEYKVFGFVGNVGTATGLKTLPIALEHKRVYFAPYTGAKMFREKPPARYVFNFRASYDEETAAIVQYLRRVRRVKPEHIAVFLQNDAYGESGLEGVKRALTKEGFDPAQTLQARYERNSPDVDDAVAKIVQNKDRVKAVVMVATYQQAAAFIKKVHDAKVDVVFTNVSFVGGTNLGDELRKAGPGYADGVIVTQVVPFPESHATTVMRYREVLKKYAPAEAEPGFLSLEGYLAALVLVEGLKNAGPDLNSDTLVDGLEKIRDFDLGIGAKISYSPSEHQASHTVWGTVLDAEGKFRTLDLE